MIWNISIVVPETITNSQRLGIVKNNDLINYNVENITISETYLDAGRVVGELVLLIMGFANNHTVNIICLCSIIFVVCIYLFHIFKLNKLHVQKVNIKN